LQAVSHAFLLALERGTLLRDGAMGTLPHDRAVPLSARLEAINLESLGLVTAMHGDSTEAGAETAKTTLSARPAFVSSATA
jgi:methionine synthase I (cobalamin-dependent)